MTGPSEDWPVVFEPEDRKNPVVALPLALCAGLVLYLAVDVYQLTQGREPGFVLSMVLIGLALAGAAGWAWHLEPMVQARLVVGPERVSFAQWRRRRHKRMIPQTELAWSEIKALRLRAYPRSQTAIGLECTSGGGRDDTKTFWIRAGALAARGRDPLKTLVVAAQRAGYQPHRRPSIWSLGFEQRWSLGTELD